MYIIEIRAFATSTTQLQLPHGYMVSSIGAFSNRYPVLGTLRRNYCCFLVKKNSNDQEVENVKEFNGFNPFDPKSIVELSKKGEQASRNYSKLREVDITPGGQISIRQMKMKELTSEILNCISNPESLMLLLESNEEFLLEQLNNEDAVLELDSVFHTDMDRAERFVRYAEVMDQRIQSARVPDVKLALRALRDFVLSRE